MGIFVLDNNLKYIHMNNQHKFQKMDSFKSINPFCKKKYFKNSCKFHFVLFSFLKFNLCTLVTLFKCLDCQIITISMPCVCILLEQNHIA